MSETCRSPRIVDGALSAAVRCGGRGSLRTFDLSRWVIDKSRLPSQLPKKTLKFFAIRFNKENVGGCHWGGGVAVWAWPPRGRVPHNNVQHRNRKNIWQLKNGIWLSGRISPRHFTLVSALSFHRPGAIFGFWFSLMPFSHL